MDPDNPVIRLCVQGVEAEQQQRLDDARALYENAWRAARNDVEACIAAHYIARAQPEPMQMLWWNQIALARADASRDEYVRSFYASLHLNLGIANEKLGQIAAARHHYLRASDAIDDVADPEQRLQVLRGIDRGLARTERS